MTQLELVEEELKTKGYITRNFALKNYVSRLGSLIKKLEYKGLKFEKKYFDTHTQWGKSKDYIYKLVV